MTRRRENFTRSFSLSLSLSLYPSSHTHPSIALRLPDGSTFEMGYVANPPSWLGKQVLNSSLFPNIARLLDNAIVNGTPLSRRYIIQSGGAMSMIHDQVDLYKPSHVSYESTKYIGMIFIIINFNLSLSFPSRLSFLQLSSPYSIPFPLFILRLA